MSLSRAEAEALRDAIQVLLWYFTHRPTSPGEQQEAGAAWQTIDRLTSDPISVPGEDAQTWTFRFRKDAWTVFDCAAKRTWSWAPDVEAMKRLKDCQDTLRVIPAQADNPSQTRGRKRSCDWQKDKDVAEDWERAKGAGTVKKDFARDKGLRVAELNRILNRHAKRARK